MSARPAGSRLGAPFLAVARVNPIVIKKTDIHQLGSIIFHDTNPVLTSATLRLCRHAHDGFSSVSGIGV
jgi:hypothetical protein